MATCRRVNFLCRMFSVLVLRLRSLRLLRVSGIVMRLRMFLLLDRKSGSAGMPRPISYAVFCLKKNTRWLHWEFGPGELLRASFCLPGNRLHSTGFAESAGLVYD